jgi:hypothetical protein
MVIPSAKARVVILHFFDNFTVFVSLAEIRVYSNPEWSDPKGCTPSIPYFNSRLHFYIKVIFFRHQLTEIHMAVNTIRVERFIEVEDDCIACCIGISI